MGKAYEILRRDSRGTMQDFYQRMRAGLYGAALILAISEGVSWIIR